MANIILVGKNISDFDIVHERWTPVNFPNTKLYAIIEDPEIISGEKKITMRGYLCHVDADGVICRNLGVKEWVYEGLQAVTLINSIKQALIIGTEVSVADKIQNSLSNEENGNAFDAIAASCVPPFIKPE